MLLRQLNASMDELEACLAVFVQPRYDIIENSKYHVIGLSLEQRVEGVVVQVERLVLASGFLV